MTVRILTGDCRAMLATLPDESVHCVVTSPPYFGLRDYETGRWEGGDADCDHRPAAMRDGRNENRRKLAGSAATNATQLLLSARADCGKCGATKEDRQIGLEPTPEEYIDELRAVFAEVYRVLRKDGTLWLNIADSYAASGGIGRQGGSSARAGRANVKAQMKRESTRPPAGYKPKDLIGIPWMLAFALRADGWYLRQEIIWNKPNPMPESVVDRCTKAHESLFLFAKSGATTCWRHEGGAWVTKRPPADYVWRNAETGAESAEPVREKGWRRVNRWRGYDYYFDHRAISEPIAAASQRRLAQDVDAQQGSMTPSKHNGAMKAVTRRSGNKARKPGTERGCPAGSGSNVCGSVPWEGSERNKRDVWTVATVPYSESHFATFPPALIVDPIKAGCPRGGTVLDPFGGAGTTALVADRLQRHAILIELNPDYAAMAQRRIDGERAGFPMLEAMGA